MKKSLVAAFFLCCFSLCFTVANVSAADDVKIATISIQQILSTSSAALAAQKNIQEEVKKFQEKFKPMEDELSAVELLHFFLNILLRSKGCGRGRKNLLNADSGYLHIIGC